ncbi:TPA_asm: DNA primase/polymerase [Mycobacterium phage McProf]|uniref:bifunctional DNA primase/polymerase n=1 Tax=Mycobacteroides chelonae TaxID=1774 RepID=UPI000AA7C90E|nr:bifunctional DNA primase/polymerase [Mycobacteroides chelonae]VEG15696.1 RecA-family ATPase-like protein [Mycolicibacterium phlei]DAZ90011.1 TPA_asm: DNA primase/polymerase [Mycobacterium phage McProf]
MFTYSTCVTCNTIMIVTDHDQRQHPECAENAPAPTLTRVEQLTEKLRATVHVGDQHELEARIEAELKTIDEQPPALGLSALFYATEYGWPVFPLEVGGKRPAIAKKDGGNGFKDATTDPERIKKFWTKHPLCNIGIPTGIHFDVIDVDVPDGWLSLRDMLNEDRVPDVHGRVATSSGGVHLLIEPTGDGNSARIAPGIDYRGAGGYVVAPPSRIDPQHRWSWTVKPSPKVKGERNNE